MYIAKSLPIKNHQIVNESFCQYVEKFIFARPTLDNLFVKNYNRNVVLFPGGNAFAKKGEHYEKKLRTAVGKVAVVGTLIGFGIDAIKNSKMNKADAKVAQQSNEDKKE